MLIAFDVDGCLINDKDEARPEIVELLKMLSKGNKIIVWSASLDYAELWTRRLGLSDYVSGWMSKRNATEKEVDIAFDDQEVKLAKCNIKI